MKELKSKHCDIDAAFKSVVNVASPFRQESESKDVSMNGSQILEISQLEN
jgi:hypothetical protein